MPISFKPYAIKTVFFLPNLQVGDKAKVPQPSAIGQTALAGGLRVIMR